MFWQMVKGGRFKSDGTADAIECLKVRTFKPRSYAPLRYASFVKIFMKRKSPPNLDEL